LQKKNFMSSDNNETAEFYITHLVPDILPQIGLRKLLFFTTTESSYNKGKYYWGLDLKNPFSEAKMKELERQEKAIKILPRPVKVKKGEGIWLNSDGKVCIGDLINPYLTKKDPFFSPTQLSKAGQIYRSDIGVENVPIPKIAMSL
jgi:hypothetical protein